MKCDFKKDGCFCSNDAAEQWISNWPVCPYTGPFDIDPEPWIRNYCDEHANFIRSGSKLPNRPSLKIVKL